MVVESACLGSIAVFANMSLTEGRCLLLLCWSGGETHLTGLHRSQRLLTEWTHPQLSLRTLRMASPSWVSTCPGHISLFFVAADNP